MAWPGVGVGGQSPSLPLHGYGRIRDLPPDRGALRHLSAILGRGEPVVSRTAVLSDGTIPGEKALGVSCGFKPLHPPLSLVARLMRVFRTPVEVAVRAMFHTREIFPFRRPIALQLIGDDHAWDILLALKDLAAEFLGGDLIAPSLYQNIEHVPVLVDGAPEVMPFAVDAENHSIQVPRVAGSGAPAAELIGILLTELVAPLLDRFIRHDDAAGKQARLHIAVAEAEAEIQPHRVADDFGRKAMIFVVMGR
jgi:hypothetical protein